MEILVAALRHHAPDLAIDTAASLDAAASRIRSSAIDAMLLDVSLPDGEGFAVVQGLRERGEEIPFVFVTADSSAPTAVRALQAGAADYVVKGAAAADRAAGILRGLVDSDCLRREPESMLIGSSAVMSEVRAAVRRCGRSVAPVRIEGETGVGKELVARAIHAASDRARGPFVALNCGALPEALAEAELFGHVRGAFTGASGDRSGLVEHAAGGTLMLDEVEDLPRSIQGKLLRLIQEGEYRPVGTARVRLADVRILAASNRDLGAMVEDGGFRRDLFYRLDVLRVRVPALRERASDVAALVEHLLARKEAHLLARKETQTVRRGFAQAVAPLPAEIAEMQRYEWPGNVRELENFVERARAVAEAAGWRAGWASAIAQLPAPGEATDAALSVVVAESPPRDAERVALERLLGRHRWRRETVARELGISRVTLWRRMRRHGLIGDA